MIYYLAFCFLTLLFMDRAQRCNKVLYLIIAVFIISFLSGFRDLSVGTDTMTYAFYIEQMGQGHYLAFEYGFRYLTILLYKLFKNVNIVLFVYALLINGLFFVRFWIMRDEISVTLATLFYLVFLFPQSLNILRQFIAMAIVFFFSYYLEKNKYITFFISVIVAFFFHKSALLAVFIMPIYYMFGKKSSTNKLLFSIFSLLSLIVFSSFLMSVLDKYTKYFRTQDISGVGWFIYIRLIPLVLFVVSIILDRKYFVKTYKANNKNKYVNIYALVYFAGIIISIIGVFYNQMGRIGLYFSTFELLFASCVCKQNYFRPIIKTFYIVLVLLTFMYKTCYQGECGIMPYSFAF